MIAGYVALAFQVVQVFSNPIGRNNTHRRTNLTNGRRITILFDMCFDNLEGFVLPCRQFAHMLPLPPAGIHLVRQVVIGEQFKRGLDILGVLHIAPSIDAHIPRQTIHIPRVPLVLQFKTVQTIGQELSRNVLCIDELSVTLCTVPILDNRAVDRGKKLVALDGH